MNKDHTSPIQVVTTSMLSSQSLPLVPSSPSPTSSCSSLADANATSCETTIHPQKRNCKRLSTAATVDTTNSNSDAEDEGNESSDDNIADYFHPDYVAKLKERARIENSKLNLNLGLPVDLTRYTATAANNTDTTDTASKQGCHTRENTGTGSAISDSINLNRPTFPSRIARILRSTASNLLHASLRIPLRTSIHCLHRLLSLIEHPLFQLWSRFLPLKFRQKVAFMAWKLYLPIHTALIGRRSGLHKDVSLEYHALTSVMWWGRLFPMTIQRIRFSLSQLHVCHPPDAFPSWNSLNKFHAGKQLSNHNASSNSLPPAAAEVTSFPGSISTKSNNGKQHGIQGHLHEVYHEMTTKRTPTGTTTPVAPTNDNALLYSKEEMTVTGLYIQHASRPSQKVIFWIYGGAFLAGDSRGNLGIAEKMGMMTTTTTPTTTCSGGNGSTNNNDNNNHHCQQQQQQQMRDVFIPDYRLVPEHHLDDALHDVVLAYEYLLYQRGILPENVTLLGISSGGGLVVLLLQALAEARSKFERGISSTSGDGGSARSSGASAGTSASASTSTSISSSTSSCSYVAMPAGGVLMCPFVDYTEPKGSMEEYIKHDLIVNQSVYEEGIPYLEKVLGCHENRVRASPVYGNFTGLPPLCVCVSEHEVVYDQTMLLAQRAKDQGVDVTVGVWKYMCHVFPMLCPFIPEGRESFNFIAEWIKKR